MNYKTVILYTSLCLLSSSSLTTIYASAAASSSNALAAVSLTDEVTSARLRPQDMLLVPFLQDKTEAEVKDIKRRAIEAAIKRPDASAMPLLEEAILYGYLPSMVALGEIYEQQGQLQVAYEWYILAFEEHWLTTGKHLLSAKMKLKDTIFIEKLSGSLEKRVKKQKEKFFERFNNPIGFFSFYPELLCGVEVCIDKISKRSFEQSPYLTQDYDNDRNMRLLAKNFEVNGESDEESISTASDPWFFAGQQFLGKHHYIKAIRCYQRSGSIMALHNIGILYEEGKVYDKPNYQEAAKYYLLSNSKNSLFNLGILHCQGKLSADGEPNYHEAVKCYELSEDPDSLCNAGILYAVDKLGAPDYKKAAELYTKSKTSVAWLSLGNLHSQGKLSVDGAPNYQEAVKYYELSEDPDSLCNAGVLYAGDKLGSPNYKKAEELYIRSKTSLAFFNLGYLYHIGKLSLRGEPDYHKAAEYYTKSGISDALNNIGIIHMNIFSNFKEAAACFIKSSTIDAQINLLLLYKDHSTKLGVDIDAHALNNKLHDQIRVLSVTEQLYFLGRRSFLNEQYEEAILCFSQALSKGYSNADCWLKNAEKALEIKQMEEKLAAQPKVDTSTDSTTAAPAQDKSDATEESDTESSDDTDDDVLEAISASSSSSSSSSAAPTSSSAAPPSSSSSSSVESTAPIKAYKRQLNASEKIAKKKVKLQQAIAKALSRAIQFKSSKMILGYSDAAAEELKPLDITFMNNGVKAEYESLLVSTNSKLARLVEDITNKPWATEGEGKPEVLIGKFMGYRGCLSRRFDGENRLVYKVKGSSEIFVLACSGHYQQR